MSKTLLLAATAMAMASNNSNAQGYDLMERLYANAYDFPSYAPTFTGSNRNNTASTRLNITRKKMKSKNSDEKEINAGTCSTVV